MNEQTKRLDHLDRQVQRLRRTVNLLAVGLLGCAGAFTLGAAQEQPQELTLRKLSIVDAEGNVQIMAGTGLDGGASISHFDREQDEARLGALEGEMERAIDLGVRTGGLDVVTRELEALRREREEVTARLAEAPPELPSSRELRLLIEARVMDFRAAFEAEPVTMRRAIRALLGERRLAVREDAERGFCVEGLVGLPLVHETPGVSQTSGRLQRLVAGGRYTPGEERRADCPVRLAA